MRNIALTFVITAALAATGWQAGRAHASLAEFQILVERTAKGVNLKCTKGCALEDGHVFARRFAKLSCSRRAFPCRWLACHVQFGVDGHGVGPAPEDP
jgi:hypothetical protein